MAEKASGGKRQEKKLILNIEDCFTKPELDGGEEKQKLWHFYRKESDEDAIIRKAKQDAYEHQSKYLMCSQSTYYGIARNLGIAHKEVYKSASYLCGGMGGTNMCGNLLGARLALGQAYGRDNMYTRGWPRENGPSNLWDTLPIADEELSNAFSEKFSSVQCHEIQENYFGRHFFLPSDYLDSEIMERHQSGVLYRIVSVHAAYIAEWCAAKACEIILREWKKRGIPIPMPL